LDSSFEDLVNRADVYKERALHFIKSLQTHCPLSTIEIPTPSGGMFLWVRLKIESHPKINSLSPDEISQRVFDTFIQEKILTTPGRYFRSPRVEPMTREEEVGKTFIRLSYALPSFQELEEGAKRMGRALRQEWEL
jgi:aromatic amino acid aminotransferase I